MRCSTSELGWLSYHLRVDGQVGKIVRGWQGDVKMVARKAVSFGAILQELNIESTGGFHLALSQSPDVEGINNKIKALKRKACGCRDIATSN